MATLKKHLLSFIHPHETKTKQKLEENVRQKVCFTTEN